MEDRRVMGSVVLGYLKFIKKKWGTTGLEELLRETGIGPNRIVEAQWYPLDISRNVLEWVDKRGSEKVDTVKECGKFAVQNLGFLNYIVGFMNVASILERAPNSYKDAFSVGHIEVDVNKKERVATVKMFNSAYHEYSCRAWKGCYEGMLEVTKTVGTVEKTLCELKGDPHCEYFVDWRKNR